MKRHLEKFQKLPVLLFVILLTVDVSILIMEKFAATISGGTGDFSIRLLQIPWVWGIGVLSLVQLLVWNKILRTTALSIAYPISSLFFPLTMMFAVLLFHEHVTWLAWLGGLLVTLGIGCFSGSQNETSVQAPQTVQRTSKSSEVSATIPKVLVTK